MSAGVPRTCETSPAACHVVPAVSPTRSITTTSVHPSRARWYAIEAPMIPPPTIATRAPAGGASIGDEDRIVEVAVRQALLDHRPRSLPGG